MLSCKKAIRILLLSILIILAVFGAGMFGLNRDPYAKNENPIENVVKKDDEEESEQREIKE